MTKNYDLVILGGGPGGYVSAIRASQLGMKVALVEKEKLGGTCLHYGCIPTKVYLHSAEVFQQTKMASTYGIQVSNVELDFPNIQHRKNDIVTTLHKGIHGLMTKGKIDIYHGFGRILGPSIFSPLPGTISIEYEDSQKENTMLVPKYVLIATGSQSKGLHDLPIDHRNILSSDDVLQLEQLPQSIIIVGSGAIGIEWASMLNDFGVEVTVIEQANRILPQLDASLSKEAEKQLSKKGIVFLKEAEIVADSLSLVNGVSIDVQTKDDQTSLQAEKMLIAIGRKANSDQLGLENTNVERAENGKIQVNSFYQTKDNHIYAIGDVIGGEQLAHVASREGILAVEHMAGKQIEPLDYESVPKSIYSNPEIASIGLTEDEARAKGYDIATGKFSFAYNGKALIHGNGTGFVKIITDKRSEDLLGIHMIGPKVTELISEGGLAKVLDATPWEISQNIYPHPTLSEVIGEAALAIEGLAIHK